MVVHRLITSNRNHPAIVLVIGELDDMLATAARDRAGNPCTPGRQDWRGKMTRELARLHAAGLTGRDVFRVVAGVFFFFPALPPDFSPPSPGFPFAHAPPGPHLSPFLRFSGSWVAAKRRGRVVRKGTAR